MADKLLVRLFSDGPIHSGWNPTATCEGREYRLSHVMPMIGEPAYWRGVQLFGWSLEYELVGDPPASTDK